MAGSSDPTVKVHPGELLVYVGLGQSLLGQRPYLRPLGETSGWVDRRRAQVFSANGDPKFNTNPLVDLLPDALATTYPHRRTGRSGPLTAASAEILTALGPDDVLLTMNLAQKAAPLTSFGAATTTAHFRNLRLCLERAAEIAQARSLRLERLVVSWVHGQAGRRARRDQYAAQLCRIVDDINGLFQELTGGKGRLVFCLSQTTATAPPDMRGAALAQLDVAAVRPDCVIVAGPEYMIERSDGVHIKPKSAVYLGALHGRATAHALRGEMWKALHIVDVSVSGCTVKVRFAGGQGALELASVGQQAGAIQLGARPVPNLGFRWIEAGRATAKILAATITGPREVELSLTQAPLPGVECGLWLGFPEGIGTPEGFLAGDPTTARGGCTNLRTAGNGTARVGLPLQDWALQEVFVLPPVPEVELSAPLAIAR
jgi:hypothetical protein